jgi:hypothetical protein
MRSLPERDPRIDTAEALVRAHYEDFNTRRLQVAAARFQTDARIENITGQTACGPEGFVLLAQQWLTAFPDGRFLVESVRPRGASMYDAELIADGTHSGILAFGSWSFRPSNVHVQIPARELFQIEGGQFRLASLSFDLQDLVRQLAAVDTKKLRDHLTRIRQLGESIEGAEDPTKQRELIDRLGRQLDAARHIVRPYFRGND